MLLQLKIFAIIFFYDDQSRNDIGIAIIYPKNSAGEINVFFENGKDILVIYRGSKYNVSTCTGSEGVHVYSDPNKRHLYYALGYEVVANCPKWIYE